MVAYYENDGSDGGEKRVIPVAIVILARFFISLQGASSQTQWLKLNSFSICLYLSYFLCKLKLMNLHFTFFVHRFFQCINLFLSARILLPPPTQGGILDPWILGGHQIWRRQ